MNKCELPSDLKELFQLADAIKSVPSKTESTTDLPEMVERSKNMRPLGYFGIRADRCLEATFASQNKKQLVSLASQLLEAITLAEFDDYQDQAIFDDPETLERMSVDERLRWLQACVNRMVELSVRV